MEWESLFDGKTLLGGKEYYDKNAISNFACKESEISADVNGVDVFHVNIQKNNKEITKLSCSCPFACSGNKCRHMAAVLYKAEFERCFIDVKENDNTSIDENVNEEAATVNDQIESPALGNDIEPQILPDESITIAPPTPLGEEIALQEDEKGNQHTVNHRNDVDFKIDINSAFMYALYHNHQALINSITITNNSFEFLTDLHISISDDLGFVVEERIDIEDIAAGETKVIKNPDLGINIEKIASLTERIQGAVNVVLASDNEEVASFSSNVWFYTYNQWPGIAPGYGPDLLTTFITPNHPAISSVILAASKWLDKWTGSPAMDGYQSEDDDLENGKNRVLNMACAVYAALQEKNIVYAEAPISFRELEENNWGQRIRLADEVLENKLGTCMDLTILYATCLEAIGLRPLLIMMDGHIFAGVWLIKDGLQETWSCDPSEVLKRVADGVNVIIVVECTAMCAGNSNSFDTARMAAKEKLYNYDKLQYVVDVHRARNSNIKPMPIMVKGENGFNVYHEERSEEDITKAPKAVKTEDIDFEQLYSKPEEKITKQVQWERKLLDLSLRNMLINVRLGSIVPLLFNEELVGSIEDHLSDGQEYEIIERPNEWNLHDINSADDETLGNLGPYEKIIETDVNHHKLRAFENKTELKKKLTKIYRTAKTSMEENGASTLYLTIGVLRWTEGVKKIKAHLAPLILLPVNIKTRAGNTGFVLSLRDDEAQINITLLEFLKQNYGLEIPGLNPIPKDDHGIDVDKIIAIFRHAIMDRSGWNVEALPMIGNFSFAQFVMWNDIHSRSAELEENKIVKSLITGVVDWDNTVPEDIDSQDAYLPVSVDASQLKAINMAANDVSFVLYGPPGTGKSQTITALIANALAKRKTVLFVAEKMAALSVVQKRLAALGIGDFCLELYSNKAVKRDVLAQLKRTMDISVWGMKTDYDQKIQELHEMRDNLNGYMKALHEKRAFGLSVREALDEYEAIPNVGQNISFSREFLSSIDKNSLTAHRKLIDEYIAALNIIGNPKDSPFYGSSVVEYSQSLKLNAEEKIDSLRADILALKQISDKFVNNTNIVFPVNKKQWENVQRLIDGIKEPIDIPEFMLQSDNIGSISDKLVSFVTAKQDFSEARDKFLETWRDESVLAELGEYKQLFDDTKKRCSEMYDSLAACDEAKNTYNIADIYNCVNNADNTYELRKELKDKVKIFDSQLDILKQKSKEFAESVGHKIPFTGKELADLQKVFVLLKNPVNIPDSILNAPSIDEIFVKPSEFLKEKANYDCKKAQFDLLWNQSFLAMDMKRYQDKYDEAGKKFFGKKKAYEQLAAELQAFCKAEIPVEKIPLRLAEVIDYKEEQKKYEALRSSFSYEWLQIIEEHPCVAELMNYKEQCKIQIRENTEYINLAKKLKNENSLKKILQIGEEFDKSLNEVIESNNDILTELKLNIDIETCDWFGVKYGLIQFIDYCISRSESEEKIIDLIQPYAKEKLEFNNIESYFSAAQEYIEQKSIFEDKNKNIPEEWNETIEKYNTVDQMAEFAEHCKAQFNNNRDAILLRTKLNNDGTYDAVIEDGKKINEDFIEIEKVCSEICELLGINYSFSDECWLESREEFALFVEQNLSKIKDWMMYEDSAENCNKAGLGEIVKKAEEGTDKDKLRNIYFKSIYKALILKTIEEEPALNRFTGVAFEQRIAQYKQLEDEFVSLTKEEMYYKLTHNLPTPYQSPEISKELSILRKAISSGGRGLSIRSLIDQIPHILTRLCPCLLMSPISVSQYLSTDCDKFDVVVFDEASQLPTCKAVGVIARGKNAVIVGDPNQMPPTSFFAGNVVDEDNLDIEDLDSILDDCLALGMPSTHLKWHYRSRHESLIAFSNHEYYDNSMLTFPSVNDRERRVKLVTINGRYNRKEGRINKEEGAAIIKEIRRRYESENLKKLSLGVVTFNIKQEDYIQKLLDDEFAKDLEFEKWAKESEEPLFVKNLENVQGDERDVILFSICFGPDEEGKISLNFGPLNKENGWKRLNVAISRAKYEMIVFSSMTPEMIDTSRTSAKGVEGVRGFLEFARSGEIVAGYAQEKHSHQGISDKICEALTGIGYKVSKDVGRSEFRVDVAVVNPYDEDEYLLGILLDGDSYKQTERAKDREVSQMSVLQGLGWNLHRVWAVDWWDDSDNEIQKIKLLLDDLVRKAAGSVKEEKDSGPESEEITPVNDTKTKEPKEKKKKEEIPQNKTFDEHDRFKVRKDITINNSDN